MKTNKNETTKILGENIWRKREAFGMSRGELAEKVGTSRYSISDWELGKCMPSKQFLRPLAKALECSINDLHRKVHIPTLDVRPDAPRTLFDTVPEKPSETKLVYDKDSGLKLDNPKRSETSIRLNKYLKDNNMTLQAFSNTYGISIASCHRIKSGHTSENSPATIRMKDILDKLEAGAEVSTVEPVELEPVPENELKQPTPTANPGSLSERLNNMYDVLFNTLAELDELKADIAKIEKVTSLLKEIQGL